MIQFSEFVNDVLSLGADRYRVSHVPTGFEILDGYLGGGYVPGLHVIGGIPGSGKSALALQMSYNMTSAGTPVFYISLEMSKYDILLRMISLVSALNAKNKCSREMTAVSMAEAEALLTDSPETFAVLAGDVSAGTQCMEISDVTDTDRTDIESNLIRAIETFADKAAVSVSGGKTPVVVIDYLQYVVPDDDGRGLTDKQHMDMLVGKLKKLSKQRGIVIVALSSLSRAGYDRTDMSSYKESGSIEYAADTLIALSSASSSGMTVKLLKQKNGPTADIPVVYDRKHNHFEVVKKIKTC